MTYQGFPKERKKEYDRLRLKNRSEELKKRQYEQNKRWRLANPDKVRKGKRDWYKKNRLHILESIYNRPNNIYCKLMEVSRRRGWEVLSKEDFMEWYKQQEQKCIYCGIGAIQAKKYTKRRLNIDRMDSKKGYIKGNMVLACNLCNRVKTDVLTFEEMLYIGKKFIKPKWSNIIEGGVPLSTRI